MAAGQAHCADTTMRLPIRRQEILRAAVLTFARYGYRKTSLNAGAHHLADGISPLPVFASQSNRPRPGAGESATWCPA